MMYDNNILIKALEHKNLIEWMINADIFQGPSINLDILLK